MDNSDLLHPNVADNARNARINIGVASFFSVVFLFVSTVLLLIGFRVSQIAYPYDYTDDFPYSNLAKRHVEIFILREL